MSDTSDPDKDDQTLFRASVKGVRPLRRQQAPPRRRRAPPSPRRTPQDEPAARDEFPASEFVPAEAEAADELLYARPGLQHGVMRKLRRGQFASGAELDLHGMTVPLARRALHEFLERCRLTDMRCARVIHGKGLSAPDRPAVLKSRVNSWLRQHDDVLAFCSARPQDGGTGAVYVLLRNRR